MKSVFFVLAMFLGQVAMGAELNCWITTFMQAKVPFLTAKVESHSQLSRITFNYKASMAKQGVTVQDYPGKLSGELIVSNHSPYKGRVRYVVKASGEIILPTNLSNQNLLAILKNSNENGVFITSYDGGGSNIHRSYRLACRTDI